MLNCKPKEHISEIIAFISLIALAAIAYAYKINDYPLSLHGRTDMYVVNIVNSIIDSGLPRSGGTIYFRGWTYYYPTAIIVKILGMTEASLRIVNIIYMIGTLIVTYLMASRMFGSRVGFTAMVITGFAAGQASSVMITKHWPAIQFYFMLATYIYYKMYVRKSTGLSKIIVPLSAVLFIITDFAVFTITIVTYISISMILKNNNGSYDNQSRLKYLIILAVVGIVSLPLITFHGVKIFGRFPWYVNKILTSRDIVAYSIIYTATLILVTGFLIKDTLSEQNKVWKIASLILCSTFSIVFLTPQALLIVLVYILCFKPERYWWKKWSLKLYIIMIVVSFIPIVVALYKNNMGFSIFAVEPIKHGINSAVNPFILMHGFALKPDSLFFIIMLISLILLLKEYFSESVRSDGARDGLVVVLLIFIYTVLFSIVMTVSVYPTYPHEMIHLYPLIGIMIAIMFYKTAKKIVSYKMKSGNFMRRKRYEFIMTAVLCLLFTYKYGYPMYYNEIQENIKATNWKQVIEVLKGYKIGEKDVIFCIGNNQSLIVHYQKYTILWDNHWDVEGTDIKWWSPIMYKAKLDPSIKQSIINGGKVLFIIFTKTQSEWNDNLYRSEKTIEYIFKKYNLMPIINEKRIQVFKLLSIKEN